MVDLSIDPTLQSEEMNNEKINIDNESDEDNEPVIRLKKKNNKIDFDDESGVSSAPSDINDDSEFETKKLTSKIKTKTKRKKMKLKAKTIDSGVSNGHEEACEDTKNNFSDIDSDSNNRKKNTSDIDRDVSDIGSNFSSSSEEDNDEEFLKKIQQKRTHLLKTSQKEIEKVGSKPKESDSSEDELYNEIVKNIPPKNKRKEENDHEDIDDKKGSAKIPKKKSLKKKSEKPKRLKMIDSDSDDAMNETGKADNDDKTNKRQGLFGNDSMFEDSSDDERTKDDTNAEQDEMDLEQEKKLLDTGNIKPKKKRQVF